MSIHASPTTVHSNLDEWIARDAIRFEPGSAASLETAIDRLVAGLDPAVELLALGEARLFSPDSDTSTLVSNVPGPSMVSMTSGSEFLFLMPWAVPGGTTVIWSFDMS